MNRLIMGGLAGAVSFAGALALLTLASGPAGATHVPLTLLAVDTNTTGNTLTSLSGSAHTEVLGTVEACNTISAVDGTLDIDLIVKGVPAFNSGAFTDGIIGTSGNLHYDKTLIKITAYNAGFLNAAIGKSPFGAPPTMPNTTGNLRFDDLDLGSNIESGDGVLIRFTIQRLGSAVGVSPLTFDDVLNGTPNANVLDAASIFYNITSVKQGQVAVGTTCGASTPTPTPPTTPTPTPSPTPITASPTPSGGPTPSPSPTPTVGPTPTGQTPTPTLEPTPTSTATPTPTRTPTPAPTGAPTPTPTATPTLAPGATTPASPTITPASLPRTGGSDGSASGTGWALLFLIVAGGLALGSGGSLLALRYIGSGHRD